MKNAFAILLVCSASVLSMAAASPWLPELPEKFASGTATPALDAISPRSVLNRGDMARFDRVWQRLARGERIRVVTIGGSITGGACASKAEFRWGDRMAAGWRRAFPNATVEYVNCGIGATGTELAAFYLSRDVLSKKPDVVGIEFSVNDSNSRGCAESMEGVVRQLLSAPGEIAVFMLGMMNQAGGNAQEWHGKVARRYGVPYVSYRDALGPEMKAGRLAWTDVSPDTIHPNDVGHAYAAALVNSFFAAEHSAFAAAKRAPSPIPALPPPCFSDDFSRCGIFRPAEVKVLENVGFSPCHEQVWGEGLACSNANSRLVFEVEGATVGFIYRIGRKPYGIARVKVDGAVAIDRLDGFRDQWWWYTPSRFVVRGRPGRHVVEIETLGEKNPASAGYGFQLCSILLGQAGDQAGD